MGALDTFPGLGSPAPAPVGKGGEDKGLPGWAIALIIIFAIMFLGGVAFAVSKST